MNPQPEPIVGIIFAICFVVLLVYFAIKEFLHPQNNISYDKFIIGYLEDSPINIEVSSTRSSSKKLIKSNFEKQQLYVDCIDALSSLGMKKKQAKEKAKYIFSSMNPQPSSIQEFLHLALKMPK